MQATPAAGDDQGIREAAAHLIAHLRIPDTLAVDEPGKLVVRPRLLDASAAQTLIAGGMSGERIALVCGGSVSQVIVEPSLAVALVSRALGLVAPAFGGPLTRIERGVLLGTLSVMLSRLGLSPEVRLGEQGLVATLATPTGIALSVDYEGHAGQAWLLATPSLLDALCVRQGDRFAQIELATTTIPGSDLTAAAVGDRIVFDTSSLSGDDAWAVTLRCRERSRPALWWPDGLVVPAQAAEAATVAGRRAGPHALHGQGLVGGGIAVTARTAEPAPCLAWGHPLVIRRSGAVALYAAGAAWGEGEIDECDGALAVGITRLLSG